MLEPREWPEPVPGEGQLLVALEAAGVNFRDVYERRGGYGTPPPLVGGAEGAGHASSPLGAGVTEFAVGDRVAWTSATGSYAERVLVAAERAVAGAATESHPELAAAVLLQGMTAHYLATSTYPIRPRDDVLVHAAAGGVGLLLTQIAKMRGARVIATASTEDKRRARARARRRRRDRLRRLRRGRARPHRRRRRPRRLRRHRPRHVRTPASRCCGRAG